MGVIADFFARLLRMCPGRLFTGFLLIRQEVRAIFKTCNQLVNMETVQMLVTPGKQDLQKHTQVRQGYITPDKHPTPDEWADTSEDDVELVNAE